MRTPRTNTPRKMALGCWRAQRHQRCGLLLSFSESNMLDPSTRVYAYLFAIGQRSQLISLKLSLNWEM